jgi:hypothetical protein
VISDELHQESTAALPVPAVEPTVRLEDSMATLVFSKYSLRTLHEEIGLLDRKLAHLLKYEEFQTDSARQQAAARIEHKRDLLVRSAQAMVEDGVEFHASEVPTSMRTEDTIPIDSVAQVAADTEAPVSVAAPKKDKPLSPFAGTVLDGGHALELYKQEKEKKKPASLGRRTRAVVELGAEPAAAAV